MLLSLSVGPNMMCAFYKLKIQKVVVALSTQRMSFQFPMEIQLIKCRKATRAILCVQCLSKNTADKQTLHTHTL